MEATLICVLLQWLYNDSFPAYKDQNEITILHFFSASFSVSQLH